MDGLMIDPPTPIQAVAGQRRRSSVIQFDPSTRSNSLEGASRSSPETNSSSYTPADKSARCKRNQDVYDRQSGGGPEELTPTKRPGLRIKQTPSKSTTQPMEEAMKPLTDDERRNWKGWVELESDPALFNFILRQYGVQDVKVQEGLGLDDELLAFLPQPVFGLIFLFKYREEEEDEPEEVSKCPKDIWFANQTITNACATIALLNIIMNVEEIHLGQALTTFKAETRRLKSAYRGQRLGQDDFIRNVHNSFARRMDMLNADLALLNEMEKWKRTMKNPKRNLAKKPKRPEDDDEAGFHFIAYVPIKGNVWRLDGLQRQPVDLGKYDQEWMMVARDNMLQKIKENREDDQYNLLSLCKSPLLTIPEDLAKNIRSISALDMLLTALLPDWRNFLGTDDSELETGPSQAYGLSSDIFEETKISEAAQQSIEYAGDDPSALMSLRSKWALDQKELKMKFMDEAALIGQENDQAARRKHDYTSIIYNSIKILAEHGVLKEIAHDIIGAE